MTFPRPDKRCSTDMSGREDRHLIRQMVSGIAAQIPDAVRLENTGGLLKRMDCLSPKLAPGGPLKPNSVPEFYVQMIGRANHLTDTLKHVHDYAEFYNDRKLT